MGGLAVELDGMTFDTGKSRAPRQGEVQIEEHRSLLDMQFEIGSGIFQFGVALFDALEIDADGLEALGSRMPSLSFQSARFIHVQVAGAGGGTEQAFAEARAFFVGPIHQAEP